LKRKIKLDAILIFLAATFLKKIAKSIFAKTTKVKELCNQEVFLQVFKMAAISRMGEKIVFQP
jgi:hypothetical protein